jgi:hypothetical protein
MNLTLQLSSSELDDEDLQVLTRDLCTSIADETDIQAEIPSGTVAAGTKGDPVTLGAIAIAFLTHGAAVALCNVLKAYVSREPSLNIDIKRPDGTKLKLKAENLQPEQLQTLLAQIDQTSR